MLTKEIIYIQLCGLCIETVILFSGIGFNLDTNQIVYRHFQATARLGGISERDKPRSRIASVQLLMVEGKLAIDALNNTAKQILQSPQGITMQPRSN